VWPSIHLPGTDVSTSSYHLLHVIGWFAFFFVGSHLTRARPDLRRHWLWLAVAFGLCDTVGARSLSRLMRGWDDAGFYGTPLLFAAASLSYVVARRIRASPFLDAWAVAFSASHVFEKLACLAAGCCYGRPTDSWWCVALHSAQGDPTRFQPLPAVEAAMHFLTALGLGLLYARGQFQGKLLMVLGVIYGAWRSMVEPARGGRASPFLDGPLSITQVICLLVLSFSLTYLILSRGERDATTTPVGPGALDRIGLL